MSSGIYAIVNETNGKRYVGSSNNLKRRKIRHWASLRNGIHHSTAMQRAWDKYGESQFSFVMLEAEQIGAMAQ